MHAINCIYTQLYIMPTYSQDNKKFTDILNHKSPELSIYVNTEASSWLQFPVVQSLLITIMQ